MFAHRLPPGSFAVALVVGLMFVTPVLAATSLHPLALRWDVLVAFVAQHRLGLSFGFAMMGAIAMMLRAASERPQQPPAWLDPMDERNGNGLDVLS